MLSTFAPLSGNSAKDLARWAARCFAALSMTTEDVLSPNISCVGLSAHEVMNGYGDSINTSNVSVVSVDAGEKVQ